MSLNKEDVNPRYVKMLNELEKIGGIKNLLKNSHPKFAILRTEFGARIQASIDIGGLNDELRDFVSSSLALKKGIIHDQIKEGDTKGSSFVYIKEVGENYLKDEELASSAKKYIGKLFSESLNEGKENLVNYVRGTGFPGGPFSVGVESSSAEEKQDNPGSIRRFLDRISDFSPTLG